MSKVVNDRRSKYRLRMDYVLSVLLGIGLILGYMYIESEAKANVVTTPSVEAKPQIKFGFDLSKYSFESNIIKRGDVVGNILHDYGIKHNTISKLAEKARNVFSLRSIRTDKKYHIVREGECGPAVAFVYESNPLTYVTYDLRGDTHVEITDRPYRTCVELTHGEITSSLWNALVDQGINPGIIEHMEDALSSSVDFYHTQKGDQFKLIYERKLIGDKEVGLGKLLGAYYQNELGEHYAVHYEQGKYEGYYDYEGRPVTSSFLRSPVKYSRISSSFNLRRFHPIKRRTIPHLGTDYAAPYGTPIRAVADGVIEKASRSRNNGNYIKIRHDKVYQTQYLHMQKFAKGMRVGRKVKQGETIGYVGSTGLATGPHVCFRFWKNGRQVNHRREVFKPADPLPEAELPRFYEVRDDIKLQLDLIKTASEEKLIASKEV